jgi:hypothetical protein
MPTPINTLKEWFSNLKKPNQEQFWAWMDSIRFTNVKVPLDDVEGLTNSLQKKADLVNGVVPEDQLPFSVQTSEIIAIGVVSTTTNTVNLAVHSSGKNSVRIKGKIYERTFPNSFNYTAVAVDIKILILYALPDPALFFLAEGVEAVEAVEPEIPEGAIPIRRIIARLTAQIVEDYSDEFNSIDGRLTNIEIKNNDQDSNIEGLATIVGQNISEISANASGISANQAAITAEILNRTNADLLKADQLTTYTKTEVDGLVSSTFKPKGSVANYAALTAITGQKEGDVYNLLSTGENYVWVLNLNNTGVAGWDDLAGAVDLSAYQTTATADGKYLLLTNATADNIAETASRKFITAGEKTAIASNTAATAANALAIINLEAKSEKTDQVPVSANIIALESWKGKVVFITGTCTITIPATLSDNWSFNGITTAGVNLSFAITSPKIWQYGTPATITEKQIFTVVQRGATNEIYLLGV